MADVAYDISYDIGRYVVGPGLAVGLIVLGVLAQRRSRAEHERQLAQAGAEGAFVDPQQVPRERGTKRIAVGSVLLALNLIGLAASTLERADSTADVDRVRVVLAATLLGMQRHDSYFQDRLQTLLGQISDQLEQADAAYYGSPFGGLTVVAARGVTGQPSAVGDEFFSGAQRLGTLSDVKDVTAASGGGIGRCGLITLKAERQARHICAWVDKRSAVFTVDGRATSVDDAASRGRQVFGFVIQSAASAPQELREPVAEHPEHVALPATLLGSARDTKELAKERLDFLTQTKPYAKEADLGLYLGGGHGFLVEAQATDLRPHALFLDQYRRALVAELGHDIGVAVKVPAGGLGGEGTCWRVPIDGETSVACVLLDDGAYVAVVEYHVSDIATAAGHARQIRAAVEKR